jgi:hypothetical protein
MSREPSFDEIVGAEPTGGERERLRNAHQLLLQAGPPPELPPELAQGPQAGMARAQVARRRRLKRRSMLALVAAALVGAVFAIGYGIGTTRGYGPTPVAELPLKGTAAAPRARATLAVLPATAGNWPMRLVVVNLPKLPGNAYYGVYLVRKGEHYLSCGTFLSAGGTRPLTVSLNAPYHLQRGDTWIVTRETPHSSGRGATVLRPA